MQIDNCLDKHFDKFFHRLSSTVIHINLDNYLRIQKLLHLVAYNYVHNLSYIHLDKHLHKVRKIDIYFDIPLGILTNMYRNFLERTNKYYNLIVLIDIYYYNLHIYHYLIYNYQYIFSNW
jgi:hypothetical protein